MEVTDEDAKRAPHLKPKRIDEARSFVEQFGIDKAEYDSDILCGNRSSDGRPCVKVGGYGKYTAADAIDFAAGRPYVRRPAIEHTVQSLVGPDVELPDYLASASLRQPGHLDVLRERSPQLSAINSGGWEKVTLIVDSGASDTVIPPKVCRAPRFVLPVR